MIRITVCLCVHMYDCTYMALMESVCDSYIIACAHVSENECVEMYIYI